MLRRLGPTRTVFKCLKQSTNFNNPVVTLNYTTKRFFPDWSGNKTDADSDDEDTLDHHDVVPYSKPVKWTLVIGISVIFFGSAYKWLWNTYFEWKLEKAFTKLRRSKPLPWVVFQAVPSRMGLLESAHG